MRIVVSDEASLVSTSSDRPTGLVKSRRFDVLRLGSVVYANRSDGEADIVVVIPLYNYSSTIEECIDSLVNQDLEKLSVIVIDDCSTDGGGERAVNFLYRHPNRFSNVQVVRQLRNQGLAMARNTGIARTLEPYLFMLDADNRLRRTALSRLRSALQNSGAAFAYSQLRYFGDTDGIGVADVWDPRRLREGNYIDALALIRRSAFHAIGDYRESAVIHGWEDYDLWCRFAEGGLEGVFLPEILCEYRVHGTSMLRSDSNAHFEALKAEMALRHPTLFRVNHPDNDSD